MIQSLTCRMEIASSYGLDCAVFMHHIVHSVVEHVFRKLVELRSTDSDIHNFTPLVLIITQSGSGGK